MRDEDGSITELTPDAGARASFYGWSQDGNSFYYGYTNRDPRLEDIYEMDVTNMSATMIYQNDEAYAFNGISNDKKHMGLVRPVTTNDTDLFLYSEAINPLDTGEEQQSMSYDATKGSE